MHFLISSSDGFLLFSSTLSMLREVSRCSLASDC